MVTKLSENKRFSESSMSRIYTHLTNDNSCAIISTFRDERSDSENNRLFNQFKSEMKKDYGFIEFVSRWSEQDEETGEVISSDERALLIPNIPYEKAMKYAQKYQQSSFIFKDADGCEEICSTPFTSWDGNTYSVGDVVRTFNTRKDDSNILNLKDAEDIFAKRKGGPASHLVKGDHRSFHLESVREMESPRASYFQNHSNHRTIWTRNK